MGMARTNRDVSELFTLMQLCCRSNPRERGDGTLIPVWIGINVEHYGLHGTPEPGRIGGSESHGCVRLTNWDAARLASLVKPGTPVVFREFAI